MALRKVLNGMRLMTTKERIAEIEHAIQELASGTASDHDALSDAVYEQCAEKCNELSHYLDSIAESFRIAASPECTALMAAIYDQLKKELSGTASSSRGNDEENNHDS